MRDSRRRCKVSVKFPSSRRTPRVLRWRFFFLCSRWRGRVDRRRSRRRGRVTIGERRKRGREPRRILAVLHANGTRHPFPPPIARVAAVARSSFTLSAASLRFLLGLVALRGPKERLDRLPERVHDKTNLPEFIVVEDQTAVEDEGGLLHDAVNFSPVVRLKLVPLGHHAHRVRVPERFDVRLVRRDVAHSSAHVHRDLRVRHFRVVNREPRAVFDEAVPDVDRRRLARVPGVLLEREPEHADLLVPDRVEHRAHDALHEPVLLVVVHADDGVPVVRDFREAVALADVREVEDVLLEARPAEPDGRVQELRADPRVLPERVRNLGHVRARGLAQRGHGVDGGDSLREKRVRGELRELRGPQVRGDDPLLWDPVRVHLDEGRDRVRALLPLDLPADQDAIGRGEVVHRRALREKLGVGQDIESHAARVAVPLQNLLDRLRGPHRHGGLLDDDLVRLADRRDRARGGLPVREIRRLALPEARLLRRRVHGDEDHLALRDRALYVRGEE
eukprot:30835-Pelagococcus_subviridis.AAC.14